MENAGVGAHASVGGLRSPSGQVMIVRQLRCFASSADLTPNANGRPSANLLAAILTGAHSWQAALRRVLGDGDFRNLKNYATGKVKRSASAEALRVRFTPEVFDHLVEILRDPDTARVPVLLASFEAEAFRLARALNAYALPCRAHDDEWWAAQPVQIGAPEAALIDRTCLAVIGAELLLKGEIADLPEHLRVDIKQLAERRDAAPEAVYVTLADEQASESDVFDSVSPVRAATELLLGFPIAATPVPGIFELADPTRHPFGNWLQRVMDIFHVSSPSALIREADAAITADSAMRYARGEMLTRNAAQRLTNGIPNASEFMTAVPPARALAFVIEFLTAADRSGTLKDEQAREIACKRLRTMYLEVHFAMNRVTRRTEKAMLAALSAYDFHVTGPDWSKVTLSDLDSLTTDRALLLRVQCASAPSTQSRQSGAAT